jgi:hypothetical protein
MGTAIRIDNAVTTWYGLSVPSLILIIFIDALIYLFFGF